MNLCGDGSVFDHNSLEIWRGLTTGVDSLRPATSQIAQIRHGRSLAQKFFCPTTPYRRDLGLKESVPICPRRARR